MLLFKGSLLRYDNAGLVNGRSTGSEQDDPEDGMKPNILYESAGPSFRPPPQNDNKPNGPTGNVNDVYAEVVKPKNKKPKVNNDVYAEVVKPKAKDKKGGKKSKKLNPDQGSESGNIELKHAPNGSQGDIYENTPKKIPQERPSRRKNEDGLIYIDVEIQDSDSKQRKGVIHGIENKNEYAEVDFTKHADPLPSDDEEDTV